MKRNWVFWFEIPATDFARARAFYETVFDMEIVETMVGPLQMGIFPYAEAGGAIVRHEWYRPSSDGPVIYLNAEPDLQLALDRVAGAGGNVLVTKTQISDEHGYMAVFVDSEGNRIALHSSS